MHYINIDSDWTMLKILQFYLQTFKN